MPEVDRKTFEFPYYGQTLTGYMAEHKYADNSNTAVMLLSWEADGEYWELHAKLSINTDHDMNPGEFVANHDCTQLVEDLAALGLLEPTGETLSYGYVMDQPVYRLTAKGREFLEED
jgi:hypothetical protein